MNYINMNKPEDLYLYMKKYIKYGFTSLDNKCYSRKELNDDKLYDKILLESYFLQRPEQLVDNKYGLCTDQVELERDFFKQQGYEFKTFYSTYHNHTFLVYKNEEGKYVLFERTYKPMNGLKSFNSLDKLFDYYKAIQQVVCSDDKVEKVKIMEYSNLEYGTSFNEMIRQLKSNEKNKVLEYKCRYK